MTNENYPDRRQDVTEGFEAVSIGRAQYDIIAGRAFSSGALFEDVGAGTSVGFLLQNPAGSGVYIFVETRISTSGRFHARKIDNVTVDSAGTTMAINNRLLSDGDAVADSQKNPTISGGNPWNAKVVGSGSGGASLVGNITSESEVILQPGENVYVEATNPTQNTLDASIDVDFREVPLDEIPELHG